MNYWGKIIGGLIGLALLGPIGAVLGALWGHIIDKGRHIYQYKDLGQRRFFENTFRTMGYIAKLDGHVSEAEIKAARQVMQRMGLSDVKRHEAIHLFNEGKQPHFKLHAALRDLVIKHHHDRALLQFFVEAQCQIALAEGAPTPAKQQALAFICRFLGLNTWQFGFFEQLFEQATQTHSAYNQQQQYSQQTGNRQPQTALQTAYKMLEIPSHASHADIKKAYRRLMRQHHPDKLIAKGLPESLIRSATEKTQTIKAAYEHICIARGIK
jgi:DnaJ like chaperone protein